MLAGSPHEPPAVGALLQDSTVGAGTAIKRVRDRVPEIGQLHGNGVLLAEFTYFSGNCGEVNRFVSPITCRADTSGEAAETSARRPANRAQCGAGLRLWRLRY